MWSNPFRRQKRLVLVLPPVGTRKGLETGEVIANAVSVSATIMKSRMFSWRTMISSSSARGGRQWCLGGYCHWYLLILMALSFQVCHALYQAMMSSWWEIKISCPSLLNQARLASGSWNVPTKKGLRPVDVVLTSAQNKHAIKGSHWQDWTPP